MPHHDIAKPNPNLPTRENFDRLVRAANAGEPAALEGLRRTLDDHPEIWHIVGDMGCHAQAALVRLIADGNALIEESLTRRATELKQELRSDNPTILEDLVAQRVVTAWLEVEFVAATLPEPSGNTLHQQRFALRHKDSAQRRFDAAVKSLTLIRRLLPGGRTCEPQTVRPSRAGRPTRCRPTRSIRKDACPA